MMHLPKHNMEEPCFIDSLPDILRYTHHADYSAALFEYLEDMNETAEMKALPYIFEQIVDSTPLEDADRTKLMQRLCNAVYNMDLVIGGSL